MMRLVFFKQVGFPTKARAGLFTNRVATILDGLSGFHKWGPSQNDAVTETDGLARINETIN